MQTNQLSNLSTYFRERQTAYLSLQYCSLPLAIADVDNGISRLAQVALAVALVGALFSGGLLLVTAMAWKEGMWGLSVACIPAS